MASSRLLAKRVSEVYIVIDLSCSFVKNVLEGSGNNGKKTKKNLRELFLSNRKDLSVIDNLKTKSTQPAELNILHRLEQLKKCFFWGLQILVENIIMKGLLYDRPKDSFKELNIV